MKKFLILSILIGPIFLSTTTVFADTDNGPGTASDNNLATDITSGAGFTSTDTTPAFAKSTAEFDVIPGYLTLDAVPDFQFQSANVSDLTNGKFSKFPNGLKYQSATVKAGSSKNADAFDGNSNGNLKITDDRGTMTGWQLTAAISEFKQGDSVIDDPSLQFIPTKNSINNSGGIFSFITTISNSPSQIANARKGTNDGTFTATIGSTTSLLIPAFDKALTGTYQGTITWSLQNTPVPN